MASSTESEKVYKLFNNGTEAWEVGDHLIQRPGGSIHLANNKSEAKGAVLLVEARAAPGMTATVSTPDTIELWPEPDLHPSMLSRIMRVRVLFRARPADPAAAPPPPPQAIDYLRDDEFDDTDDDDDVPELEPIAPAHAAAIVV